MIDLKLLDKNLEIVIKNLQSRGVDKSILESLTNLNQKRKTLIHSSETKQSEIKKKSQLIGQAKKQGQDSSELTKEVLTIKEELKKETEQLNEVVIELDSLVLTIPNLLANEVPVGTSEDDNKVYFESSLNPGNFSFPVKDHVTLGENLGMLDFSSAAKITGSRFVVYKGLLAKLERVLINFMIEHHLSKGYEEIIPPFIAQEKSLVGTGNLPKFKDQLFKLEDTNWYLIPTAEIPLTNLPREEIIDLSKPLKYVAYTPCFRSEAGAAGKDIKGLIRLHQFNKVEMVQITTQENSKLAHKEMIESAKEILEKLKLPYRAVQLCSSDTGFASSNTTDLEVWVPSQGKYREISSISNCSDFQARRCMIRYKNEEGKTTLAHTLNGSGLAVGRTVVAILENYQQEDGSIKIPEVLRPYFNNLEYIKK